MIVKGVIAFAFSAALICTIWGFAQFFRHMMRAHKNVRAGFDPWQEFSPVAMTFLGWFWVLVFKTGLSEAGVEERASALKALQVLALGAFFTLIVTSLGGV